MTDISKLNKLELKELLKKLQLLNSLKKSLWNRWIKEYQKINNWVDSYKIEYYDFGETSISYFKEKSVICFNKLFWLAIDVDQIDFIPKKNLKWWMRIFFNDNMFDLSYDRFERLLK